MSAIEVILVTFAVVDTLLYNGNRYIDGDTVDMSEAEAEGLFTLPKPPIARIPTVSSKPSSAAVSKDENSSTDAAPLTAGGSQTSDTPLRRTEDEFARDGAAGGSAPAPAPAPAKNVSGKASGKGKSSEGQ